MTVLHLSSDLPPNISGGRSIAVAAIVAADPDAVALGPTDEPPTEAVDAVVLHDPALLPRAQALAARFDAPLTLYVHVLQQVVTAARGGTDTTRSEALQAAALAAADAVVVPSEAARSDLPPTTAPVRVEPPPADLPTVPRRGRGSLLYVGRFAWIKGTVDLLEAWSRVDGGGELHLVGGVPRNPKKDRWWRRKWADDPSVTDEPWLDRAVLAQRFADAHTLVVPSRAETYGLVAAEGFAAGVPMILSDLPALRELAAGRPAAWFAPGDVDALVELLRARPQRTIQP
ncbi:MAG: glycosyltransferase family 4 protein [Proteobacteria bacterium]|nr:glycosyltransferase family 4 protein [Pseudomonadota bacterium]